MKKAKKYEIIMNKIPFSCLGESDCMMRGEGRGGEERTGEVQQYGTKKKWKVNSQKNY